MTILHVLYSLSSEGSPRLALGLIEQARVGGRADAVVPLVAGPDDLRHEFEAAGVHVFDPVGWTGRDYISLLLRMRRLFRAHRFDGVVCYALGPHIAVALAAKSFGIPVVVHLGNAPPDDATARSKIRWQLRMGRRLVKVHVACSGYVRDRVVADYGMSQSDVVAILNGIDLQRFLEIRTRTRAEVHEGLRFGMVGSFETHKDQATLIRVLAEMAGRGIDARLELVGSGSRGPELREIAERLGVDHFITWTGTLGDVREALERLDVFAYSVGPEEGLGIALIEALASGIPCVGSDVGACREVLRGGALGWLAAPGDTEAWADAIVEARGAQPVPADELASFDIVATAAAYDRLLLPGGSK